MAYGVGMVSFVGASTAVCIIGAAVCNILNKRRKAEERKLSKQKELTDFLADWKRKITANGSSNLLLLYNSELPRLQTKAARLRNELGEMQRAKFNELIGDLSRLTTEQITRPNGKTPQQLIREPLEALIGFMEHLN